MHCAEYRDLVAAHVDGVLTAEEVPLAAAHVATCAACAHLLETEQKFRQAFRSRTLIRPTPAGARARLMALIEAAEEASGWAVPVRQWWSRPLYRAALAGAVTLLAVTVATMLLRSGPQERVPEVFATVVARYRAVEAQTVELGFTTDQPDELREYYRRSGAFTFTNTVVDLEPLGYVLVGGSVAELAAKKSTMTVYRGRQGLILCHRIHAVDMELPPGGEVVGGDRFYTVAGLTICIHREGDVLCFLASAMPRADFIRQLTGHA